MTVDLEDALKRVSVALNERSPLEVEAERSAVEGFSDVHRITLPSSYIDIVCRFGRIQFGEASCAVPSGGRWTHVMPESLFVFRQDPEDLMPVGMSTVAWHLWAMSDAIEQVSGISHLGSSFIPIAGSGEEWFCFDTTTRAELPIIYVDPDCDWSAQPFHAVRYVAPTFHDFLAGLVLPDQFGDFPLPTGGRRHATQDEIDWEAHRDKVLFEV